MPEIELPAPTKPKTTRKDSRQSTEGTLEWYDDETLDGVQGSGNESDSEYSSYSDGEGVALLPISLDEDADLPPPVERGFSSRLWHRHWLGPDDGPWRSSRRRGNDVLLDTAGLRLAKFLVVTAACLLAVHGYALVAGDKRDPTYDLSKMIAYDGRPIVADCFVFFCVARLYEAPAVDTLATIVPILVVAIGQSWGHTHLESLQHSITAYQVRCEWTWQMHFLVIGVCGGLLGTLLVAHCREAARRRRGKRALLELVGTTIVFVVPVVAVAENRAFVHVHHWYWAWFLGMHCNLYGTWWSPLARNVLWGIYVNGVAIFGRDPVLTCAESLYRSQSQECPYMPSEAYGLDDLARNSGFPMESSGMPASSSSSAIVCASDVTRWLSLSLSSR